MKTEHVLNLLKKNINTINRMGVKSLAVFGSTARNEAAPSSDIDILVIFDSSPTFDQYIETKFYLEDLLDCKVDLVIQDGLKPLIRKEVEKEAIYVA